MKKRCIFIWASALILFFSACSKKQQPLDELINRISENTNNQIVTKLIKSDSDVDFFEISSENNKISIAGNNTISIATGINWYLKYCAGIHISWNNLTQQLPAELPLPKEKIRHETNQTLRYYLNYCTFSYSMAFWGWERWEKEIDWMALHGINLALSITGNEVVWYNLLKRIGYTTDEINESDYALRAHLLNNAATFAACKQEKNLWE